MNEAPASPYPVRVTMEYPERLSRLATFFRILLVIPIFAFITLVGGGAFDFSGWDREQLSGGGAGAGAIGGSIVLAIWVTILIKGRIPHWLFNFQVGMHRFTTRAAAYFALLTDKYPAFEGDWVLDYDVEYPERLSRWRVFLWKLITSIPHFIVLAALSIAVFVVVVIAWFAILFTGAFPRGMHEFVVGVLRWWSRVIAYFESLTDAFPPYSLDDDAGPGSRSSETISAIVGGLILAAAVAAVAALLVFLLVFLGREKSTDVAYARVTAGDASVLIELDNVTFTLIEATDPAQTDLLAPRNGKRLVAFIVRYEGEEGAADFNFGDPPQDPSRRDIERDSLRLQTAGDASIEPELLTFNRVAAPVEVDDTASGEIVAVFEIDADDEPEELRAYPNAFNDRHVAWQFE